jgi:hypothetical protein
LDALKGECEMVERGTGHVLRPYMMHFAAKEGGFTYARQLRRLFLHYGADPTGLRRMALSNFMDLQVTWRIKGLAKRLLSGGPSHPHP